METELLVDMLRYDGWANAKMAAHLIAAGAVNDPFAKLMNHLLACHRTWLSRAVGNAEHPSPWATFRTDEWVAIAESYTPEWIAAFDADPSGCRRVVDYRNTSGQLGRSALWEMVVQLCTHGTYHRGQLNQLLSREGLPALPQDYILYARSKYA